MISAKRNVEHNAFGNEDLGNVKYYKILET